MAALLAACGTDSTERRSSAGAGGANNGGAGGANNGGNAFTASGGGGGIGVGDGGDPSSTAPIMNDGTPFVKDDTGGAGLDGATVSALKMGGGSCSTPLLYPYDGTMFPAGGLAPIVQWNGASDAAYVKMTYGDLAYVSYEFAAGASNPGRLQIPADAWNQVSSRTQVPPAALKPLQITLTTKSGGTISTCTQGWMVAPGKLSGSLYYTSYDDPAASMAIGQGAGDQGAILRLTIGDKAPTPFVFYSGRVTSGNGPCISCHSVAAKGGILAANITDYGAKTFSEFGWDIQANPNPPIPQISTTALPSASYGALSPDGSVLLAMGNPDCTAGADTYPRAPNNFGNVEGPSVATLWDVRTGKTVAAKGLSPDWYMWMPQFSPNGDKVVFNHAKKGGNGRTDRRELATMDYDAASHTFSNLQVVYHDDGPAPSLAYTGYTTTAGGGPISMGANGCTTSATGGTTYYGSGMSYPDTCSDLCYPGWPFFTPDGKKVIFARGTEPDFASAAPGLRLVSSISRLFIVDLTTKVAHALDSANGMKPDGSAYIPDGKWGSEINYDFYPTIMPIAVGGQFWLFWTSRRTYGNFPQKIMRSTAYSPSMDGTGLSAKDAKKIWVSAIDIDAPDNVDPSHPGFYLPGQGDSGNMRAFPTLAACKGDMAVCASGIDCCSGYCIDGKCGALPPACAKTQDKCADSSDCCNKAERCYGGFCAAPPPPR